MKDCCLVCDVELGNYETDLCSTCFGFFHKKYKNRLKKGLGRFRKHKAFLNTWRSTEKEVEE